MTELYLVCLSHETPMFSRRVGGTSYDITNLRAELADRDATVGWLKTLDVGYQSFVAPEMRRNYLSFIMGHPKCELEIQNDRGYRFHAIENANPRPYNPLFAHKERTDYEAANDLLDRTRTSPTGRNIFDARRTLNRQYLSTRRGGGDVYRNFAPRLDRQEVFGNWDVDGPDPDYTYVQDVNADELPHDFRVKAKSTSNIDLAIPWRRIDGFRLERDDLVLLTNQLNRRENGVYVLDGFRQLQPFRIARNTHKGRYRIMKGDTFARTTWVQLSQDPHYKNRQERNMRKIQKSVGDCLEKIDLEYFTIDDIDKVLIENCLSLGTRRDIMNDLLEKQERQNATTITVRELAEIPNIRGRKVEFNGLVRELSDYMYAFTSGWTLILDGRIVTTHADAKITVLPEE